ncbi:MAG TPA: metal ABC transporter ATP-binding protein [Actinomycetales bacterium]
MSAPLTDVTAAAPVLQLRGVSVGYTERAVVHDVDLSIRRGEVVAVLGANGSGKTTLVRGLLGLASVLTGSIEVLGAPLGARGDRTALGYVPQRHTVGGSVPSTVREVVSSGRLPRLGWFGRMRAADRAAVRSAIDAVDLGAMADTDIADLSGGQQRRALIARALASEPQVLVMDEPTAGVDLASQQALARAIERLVELGVTLVVVTHEVGPLADVVTRSIVMVDGRITYDGPFEASMLGASDGTHGHHHHVHDPADVAAHAHAPSWLAPTLGER